MVLGTADRAKDRAYFSILRAMRKISQDFIMFPPTLAAHRAVVAADAYCYQSI
jgi:hypothetical protein